MNDPRLLLTTEVKQQIKDFALSGPDDEEICGLILEDGRVALSVNEAEDKANEATFEVPDSAIGLWHTHWKDDQPALLGYSDIQQAKLHKRPSVVYHKGFDQWDIYDPLWHHPHPLIDRISDPRSIDSYIGWPWQELRSDCWVLVQMYYRGILGIELGDASLGVTELSNLEGWNRFSEEMPDHGFVEVSRLEPFKVHDVVGMAWNVDTVHHIGVITDVAKGMFLHHLGGKRLSENILYTPEKQAITLKRWRHKDLNN